MSLRPTCRKRTSESGSLTGIFVMSIPLSTLKIAVLAPMPRASDRTTTAVHPLALRSILAACWRSLSMIGVLVALMAFIYDEGLTERLTALTRASHWTAAGVVPVGFDTFHP